jgi:hypothetical protein
VSRSFVNAPSGSLMSANRVTRRIALSDDTRGHQIAARLYMLQFMLYNGTQSGRCRSKLLGEDKEKAF